MPAAVHVTDAALFTAVHSAQVSDTPSALLSVLKNPGLHTARLLSETLQVTESALTTAEHASQDPCSIVSAPKVLDVDAA